MNRLVQWATAVVLLGAATAVVADAPRPRLAVLPFTGSRLDEESLGVLADRVRSAAPELARSSGYIVMTQESMAMLIKEMGVSCTGQEECEVERARSIGASLVVSGDVRAFGKTLVLGMRLHDARTGELLAAEDLRAANSKALLDGIDGAARKLLESGLLRVGGAQRPVDVGHVAKAGEVERGDLPPEVAVAFESQPAGAQVEVDRVLLCQTTPCTRRTTEGLHEISMKLDRFKTASTRIEVKRGARVALSLQPTFASLNVRTEPKGLSLTVDGKAAGAGPVESLEVDPGEHELAVGDACWTRVSQRVLVTAGERRQVKLVGQPRVAKVRINAEDVQGEAVDGAVLIDGRHAGETGETLRVPICSKQLAVKTTDGREWSSAPQLDEQGLTLVHAVVASASTPAEQRASSKGAAPPACATGAACLEQGLGLQNGKRGQPADPVAAAALYLRACQLGEGAGCANLGYLYENGAGTSKDAGRAAAFYKRGCDAGSALGCNNLGMLLDAGRGVAKNDKRAAELFKKGCELGDLRACTNLGVDYETGTGVERDVAAAAELFGKACLGGHTRGCEARRKLIAAHPGEPGSPAAE